MTEGVQVARHKTALVRPDLSRPTRQALADGVLSAGRTLFDFGCGLGGDVRRLSELGYRCWGWDPVHNPSGERTAADVVNLGYVVNVIERPEERDQVLRDAWGFAARALVVSARLREDAKGLSCDAYEDGGLTKLRTFQKFYDQSELRAWINQTLGTASVAAAPGVFYVFREDSEREAFLARRYRRQSVAPKLRRSDVLFEQHRNVLEPLMTFVSERGRLPREDELAVAGTLIETLGSLKQAFRIIQRVTGESQWEAVRLERSEDLLVYLGLSRFDHRPRMSDLPSDIQLDIKAFFGSYTRACADADELLFALGKPEFVQTALSGARVGKLMPTALYVHTSAVPKLPTLLRMLEGCARAYVGVVEGATLVKLHRDRPQVSYLVYPEFDTDPHPALASALLVDLQTFRTSVRGYAQDKNPPILHRKEMFVAPDYPLASKFARLTTQEEKAGLFDDTASIGTLNGWQDALRVRGLALAGHRLVRPKR